MRIYPSKYIRQWDTFTLNEQGISSFQLMQRAAFTCFLWIKKRVPRSAKISVVCGPGNNGGDGLLIAAYLFQYGYQVRLFSMPGGGSEERESALQYCMREGLSPLSLADFDPGTDYVIDALFGHGLVRPLLEDNARWVEKINTTKGIVISVDIPSGMPSEGQKEVFEAVVLADHVLSFQQPKLSFFLDEYGSRIGQWEVLDIGLSGAFDVSDMPVLLDASFIQDHLKPKPRFSHKGTFGSTLLVGSSENYPGAITLATLGCLLTGVGKTFVATSPGAKAACLLHAPEAIYIPGENTASLIKHIENQSFSCIGIGPGLGMEEESVLLLRALFTHRSSWVIDADALNLVAAGKVDLPEGAKVITPHPGEFDRLTRVHTTTSERWETAKTWSRDRNCVVVLKGAHTSIFFPDGRQFINSTGNAGMAKGGSGDVLCGWIAGYIGRGYPVDEAVLIAVYLHGLSADQAVMEVTKDALKARDIIRFGESVAKKWEN